uniref:HMA domain-containing protein n=1 Tax=Oryza barthii TaxID=65489 RepID=A0A0D3G0B4_9ORYZ
MAREEELKRVDLKVNVSCCEGCRRKVMKAISLKGVLRTEINPSLDKVTVVGDVDSRVLVKKLSKVGKIAEVMAPPPSSTAAPSEEGKKSDGNGGEKPTSPADEKSAARKDTVTAKNCDDVDGDKSEPAAVAVEYQYHHHYSRPEPAMVVPVHLPYYAANATPYYAGGYYPIPPPMPAMLRHPPQLRPQSSRFDEDYFNEDNTVGCHVM